jgi:ABC-type Mn2+/Zn2+ transport system ATPase subunit
MSVYLKAFSALNYRSCQHTSFRLNPNLSILIGMNGSGKTNILNAIFLLKNLSKSRHERLREELTPNKSELTFRFSVDGNNVTYKATILHVTNRRHRLEIVRANERWDLKEITGKKGWLRIPLHMLMGFATDDVDTEFSILGRASFRTRKVAVHSSELNRYITLAQLLEGEKVQKTSPLRKLANFVSRINYYTASQYTNPTESPTSFELQDNELYRTGIGHDTAHVRFLYDLYQCSIDETKDFPNYLSIVGQRGIGLVDTIQFPEIPIPASEVEIRSGGKIVRRKVPREFVAPIFIVNRTRLSPNQLSEGTFRTLALIFYLTTDRSRLLLLEEPEVCIHHGLLASIIELVKSYADKKQIILSTHSDFVLDHVSPENVFLVKNQRGSGTEVRHLPKTMSTKSYAALKHYLSDMGNLGEYWRQTNFQND